MADDGAAERSSIEIRSLLRKLDPKLKDGGHKERVRRLARFRNYVTGSRKSTPEFYDDDLALLMLGSQAPSAVLDEELVGLNLYGLLQACGSPSEDHEGGLKRSAKNAMTLLKYLVIDHVDYTDGKPLTDPNKEPKELNGFAVALCSCTAQQLQYMNLDLHLGGDKRGGAPNDACEVIVLLLTRHLTEDGETPQPLALEALLPSGAARQAFNQWLSRSTTRSVQQSVRTAIANAATKAKSPSKKEDDESSEDEDAMNAFKRKTHRPKTEEEIQEAEKRDAALEKMGYDLLNISESERGAGAPMRWEDSKVYRAQKARKSAAAKGNSIQSMRDLEEAAAEHSRMEEERKRMHARDPLGIRSEAFDLRQVQKNRITLLEQAVKDLEEEMHEEEQLEEEDKDSMQFLTNLAAQKESLEALLDSLTGLKGVSSRSPGGEESKQGASSDGASVLPTDVNFDPLLFLTLVHRNASFQQLNDSIGQLSHRTEDQAVQLQKLVRDNFDLFIRCADGVDPFNEKGKGGKKRESGMEMRLNDLDALSESCSEQARKSFKPLLDNTNEVRKVKTALTVLHRVTPILQAPTIMRHHLDNGRYSQAVKEYRRVLVIDEHCNIDLLNHVKAKAADAARDARRELEARLAKENASVSSLMDGIRDLRELLELDVPENPDEDAAGADESKQGSKAPSGEGTFDIGGSIIHFRDNTPALSCLLLQSAHFSLLVKKTIEQTEQTTVLISEGESLSNLQDGEGAAGRLLSPTSKADSPTKPNPKATSSNQWKYDVLDARVIATIRAVDVVRAWLPRLLRIGVAAHEDEKRREARVGSRRSAPVDVDNFNQLSAFEVVITNISPALALIVEHSAFCALGSSSRASGAEVNMTFGRKAHEKLRNLLRSPLPPAQSSKCAKELAELVDVIVNSSITANGLRPTNRESSPHFARLSPLDDSRVLAEEALNAVERRTCIYAFDVCARHCSAKASGSGKFDGDALLQCLQNLTEELARPEECASEVEKGCELVVRRICEGLAGYVRDRGDSARLRAVAECAEAFTIIVDVVREVGYLSNGRVDAVEEIMMEDILGLEGAMFDEYLDNIRMNIDNCTRIGWLDMEEESQTAERDSPPTFPPYLSASLLAIVRCRAQVERALGDKVRRSEGVSYQYLAMATAADGVVEDICADVKERKQKMKVRQADRMANELQFLMNTLKNYLSDETLAMVDTTRRMLCSKAGRGGGIQGDGPDGLAALEELERLGRVYVLCLGDS